MEFDRKNIVAVDDSGIVLKMLIRILGAKYELHVFSGGERALQFLEDKTAELIILDMDMTEISGYEMLGKVREKEHLQGVPIIFLTSDSDKNQVMQAMEGGADDCVPKPIDEEILAEKVHAALGRLRQ